MRCGSCSRTRYGLQAQPALTLLDYRKRQPTGWPAFPAGNAASPRRNPTPAGPGQRPALRRSQRARRAVSAAVCLDQDYRPGIPSARAATARSVALSAAFFHGATGAWVSIMTWRAPRCRRCAMRQRRRSSRGTKMVAGGDAHHRRNMALKALWLP